MSEDLYYVLVEKTEGEAAVKVKSVPAGKGIMAYHKVYWWNVKTSGIALQDRSRKTMYPETITKIEKLMEGLEEWESNLKILDQHGSAYQLKAQAKLTDVVLKIVAEYAEKNSAALIIKKQGIIMGKVELEITTEIMKSLNNKLKEIKL